MSTAIRMERGDRNGLRISADPLVRLVEGHGGFAACCSLQAGFARKALERAYERSRDLGDVTVYSADVLAIALLGLHPLLVWGDDWLDVTPQPWVRRHVFVDA